MKPNRRINHWVRLCQSYRRSAGSLFQSRYQDSAETRLPSMREDSFTVRIELVIVQMAVGIGKHNSDKTCENYNMIAKVFTKDLSVHKNPAKKAGFCSFILLWRYPSNFQ